MFAGGTASTTPEGSAADPPLTPPRSVDPRDAHPPREALPYSPGRGASDGRPPLIWVLSGPWEAAQPAAGGESMRETRIAFVAIFGWCVCHSGQFARCEQVDGTSPNREPASVCTDSQGGSYSPGAEVEIGGKRVVCVIGPHWVPAGSPSTDPAADVLDVGDTNLAADFEAATLAAFGKSPLPTLECDVVVHAAQRRQELTHVPLGEKRSLMFWTPTCGPCKPLLADLAALADKRRHQLSVLGIVQSVDSELESPGEWALLRVKQLLTRHEVGFPTCVHSSRVLMKRWHAQGVPLTLMLSHAGVERVAAGARNGQSLVAELAGTLVK